MRQTSLVLLSAILILASLSTARAESPLPPAPVMTKGDVVDDYFATPIADPYRVLEDESLPETQAFIAAQNARTRAYLDSPLREQIKRRITELYDYPRQTAPIRRGKFLFFSTNSGLQDQAVLRVEEMPGETGRVLIDPNALSKDGTVSLGEITPTDDGALMAYRLAQGGSDHTDVHIKQIATGQDLPDLLPPARQGGIAWLQDNSGFYYSKFPKTTEHGKQENALNHQIFFHKLGESASSDELIYERPDDPELSFDVFLPDDGQYEFMKLDRGTKRENRLYARKHGQNKDPWNKIIDNEDFRYDVVEADGPVAYVHTTDGALRGRIISIDVANPDRSNWKELIPQSEDAISEVALIGEKLIVTYLHDAHQIIKIFSKSGTFEREIALPTIGSVSEIRGQRKDDDFFYAFTSFSYPTTVFRYDLKTSKSDVIFAPKLTFNPGDYETEQRFATSKDGTKVPVFVTHKKGLKLDGSNPCLLTGYGGFSISITPNFSSSRIAWMERGGVFAVACMRGGGEYGEAWHKAGMLDKKQNVFDDFIAAGEMLVSEKYTSSKTLAIQGGSNGGTLVAACMLQRPDLYGAVICQVPVADMLRFPKLGIGRFWTVEYGDAAASAEQFKYIRAYSPLHNVKPGAVYPPILITTGEGDNRVVPGHSYKFAATLQANASSTNPILLRIESKAGHGGGKPISKIIDETADIYAFLMRQFGMKPL